MMNFGSFDARFVRIGVIAISFLACSAVAAVAQSRTPFAVKRQSEVEPDFRRITQPVPVFNDRYVLERTPQQRAAFDSWRAGLRASVLGAMNPTTGAGRVWNPNAQPSTAQKAGAVTIFTVNTDFDDPDTSPGDGNCFDGATNGSIDECTLRAAIEEANATAGTDLVIINIDMVSVARGASETAGHNTTDDLWTLFVNTPISADTQSVLPPITRDNVLIDATMQLDGSGSGTFDDAYCGNPVISDSSIIKVALD